MRYSVNVLKIRCLRHSSSFKENRFIHKLCYITSFFVLQETVTAQETAA